MRVAVLGAGLGGVATAVRLATSGTTDFVVFERASGPGGVWWSNTYPGCEVDVPSLIYSYSFFRQYWPRSHASQAEVQQYVEKVIDAYGIRDRFRFDTTIGSVDWDDATHAWRVSDDAGRSLGEFEVVVSAVGLLSEPNTPTWPGIDTFSGPVFHTAQYEHEHDLTGKRVAVVGTGSTACQLVPALAPVVAHLTLYQREPGYVLPKRMLPTPADGERSWWSRQPVVERIRRLRAFRRAELLNDTIRVGSARQRRTEAASKRYIARTIQDPDLRAAVTPQYAFGCKRPVFASAFYPALTRPNVALVPHAVSAVTPTGVIDATGAERPADVLIAATGFKVTDFLCSLRVRGPGGIDLHERWSDDPRAFLGMTVPGFPNLFLVYGPNTNGGLSIVAQLERQAEVVARVVRFLRRTNTDAVDTRATVAERYDRWVQRGIARKLTALTSGCHNYYLSRTGRNVTQWPGSHLRYLLATRLLVYLGFRRVAFDRGAGTARPVSPRPSAE